TGSHILAGVRWADCDDVEIPPTAPDGIRIDRIAGPVARLVSAGLFPVVLGGDHSVTYPVLKGVFASRGDRPVNLVQFDSHIDYWDEEGGQRYTHASPIIRATRTRPGHRPRHRHTGAGGLHLLRGRG
ncbi:MAG TPA: arginase family protein, partial [Thermoleophilia bacterium]|nr:arginase family protein [Thermoleophilia bacterium]